MKGKIYNIGIFNKWKGFIGLYFTNKELRQIAKETGIKYKEVENYTLRQIYEMYK